MWNNLCMCLFFWRECHPGIPSYLDQPDMSILSGFKVFLMTEQFHFFNLFSTDLYNLYIPVQFMYTGMTQYSVGIIHRLLLILHVLAELAMH